MPKKTDLSRRRFLQYTGVVTGAAAVAVPALAMPPPLFGAAPAGHGAAPLNRGVMFFTNSLEFEVLSAAAERIFPKDSSGPGAIDLGVPYFIDNQLAGAWGYHSREYMAGPFAPGAPTQGYQSPVLRRDVFKEGLSALNEEAQRRYKKDFPQLVAPEQDQLLRMCEAGQLETKRFSSKYFFSLLRAATLAGAYADPIYNGNNNMDGWKLKEYPGAQMSYEYLMEQEKFEKIDPMSLAGM